jgi:nucleotide-binding universal stress UspA family protein
LPARGGEAPDAILRFAEQRDFDLIMMANHGRSGIRRWSMGSVAEKVLRATDIPVFLVPVADGDPLTPAGIKRVLVPLDGSDLAERALLYLKQLTSRSQMGEVALLCVVPDEGRLYPKISSASFERSERDAHTYLALIAAGLVDAGASNVTKVVRSGHPTQRIIQEAKANSSDLIILSEDGHENLVGWEFGNVADQVLHSSPAPILLVPDPVKWVVSPNYPGPWGNCCHKCGRRTYRQTFSPQDRCSRCHDNLKSRQNCIHFDGMECTLPLPKPKEKSPCNLCQEFEFHKTQPGLR